MWTKLGSLVLFVILILFCECNTTENEDFSTTTESGAENKSMIKMSEFIKKFLEHFKQSDAMNTPLPVPDPMVMPDRTYLLGVKVSTTNVTAYGVSRLRIQNFTSNVVEMKVHFGLRMPKLQILGLYFYNWLFQNYSGGFNVTIINSFSDCYAQLEVTRLGELEVSDIKMELNAREKMNFDVQNAGMIGFILNNLGDGIFDSIKPYIFRIINGNIRGNINEHLKKFKIMFPNSIPPLDLAIAEARKFVRSSNLDPYLVPDYQYATSIYSVDVTDTMVTGLSSFYRIGDVRILMDHHIIYTEANIGTEVIEGTCNWVAGVAGILTKSGTLSFTVDYIHVMINVSQPLDIRKKPKILDLLVKVGNIQLRMDGAGTLDYLAEIGINTAPNILRYQIVQATEMPMKRKIQEALDNTDVEQFILDQLPIIDSQLYKTDIRVIQDNFVEEGLVVKGKALDQECC